MVLTEAPPYDLVGIGFGPANIALSGALIEKWDDPTYLSVCLARAISPLYSLSTQNGAPRNILFLERHKSFQWHPGMLLPHARMQINFMKDLATLRNPCSPITFLNYLHAHNRLARFINRGENAPSRREYADYLGWVARYVQDRGVKVRFSTEVLSIADGREGLAHIHIRDLLTGEVSTVRASKPSCRPSFLTQCS